MAKTLQVVIDCADPDLLAQFWAEALGYVKDSPPPGFDTWEEALRAFGVPESEWNSRSAVVDPDGIGPRVFFQRVPEGKAVKNRLHLDVRAAPRATPAVEKHALVDAEAQRLTTFGATLLRSVADDLDYFHVMLDPEGNEFCVT